MSETPNTVHGRLLEAVHISGYTFERACGELEWLLDDDRWKSVGGGYTDIHAFLSTIDFSEFRLALEQRKSLAKRLHAIEVSQRATARMLGVSETTVARDLGKDRGAPKGAATERESEEQAQNSERLEASATNVAPHDRAWFQVDADPPHVSHNSGNNEWYTPPEFIAAAVEAMGAIDLDPASSAAANRIVRATRFYSAADDGLSKPWSGNIWLNPPYGPPLITQFAAAVAEKFDQQEITQACVLVNNATETAWFQRMLDSAAAVCLLRGRIKFLDLDGNPSGAPLQGQAVLYLGADAPRFERSFGSIGAVLRKSA